MASVEFKLSTPNEKVIAAAQRAAADPGTASPEDVKMIADSLIATTDSIDKLLANLPDVINVNL